MKYIRRAWWLSACPLIALAVILNFAKDIICGAYDDQGWKFWG